MSKGADFLPLAAGLTAKTQQLCLGLEDGSADLYDLVTPTTAELLRWWFLEDICQTRRFNFHPGQRQAILNAIVAHEVLAAPTLQALYKQVAPEALLEGKTLNEVASAKHAHPKYCLKMATGTGKTWVLQALLVWQLLNANAARASAAVDPRFTRNFLIVAPGLIVYDRLLDAFCGKLQGGVRDFSSSDVARYAELFLPEGLRETVFGFVRGNVCAKEEIGLKTTGNGLLAIANWHLLSESDEVVDDAEFEAPGAPLAPQQVIAGLLPLRPGKSTGNTFIASPKLLRPTLQHITRDDLLFAGQITGVEGYMGNIATGLLAGLNAAHLLQGKSPITLPPETMLGALCHYITHADLKDFQPMKANFGILPPLELEKRIGKRERGQRYADRANNALTQSLIPNP